MAAQEKISVYNTADLKNTSDDAIPNYLNSLKFKQSHTLTDVRLALGYSAFAISAACFFWDYKLGFDSTKYYTAAAVALYAVLNGALTLWAYFVEKNIIYVGTAPSGEKITIASSVTKYDPSYRLTITIVPKGASKGQTIEVARPFSEWFDSVGHFIAAPFQTMLATSVPAIAKVDSKRLASIPSAQADTSAPKEDGYSAEMLDAILSSSGSATGADPTGSVSAKKGGKRRKA
ncbi:hypothetical protein MCOR25_005464 [Pyricularia grisea]|uniref:Signal peptidase complex subunit 2 n=1 Tax=Pyricularia grisea TaxID=148305 RepID=A0A6P8BF29_PYRGI|nr:uncharacterized protein PgNI_04996 [Pyricularia grisea]KAI6365170.1 hypothetical protein MCOR25_005464 [Pyricularia grisea]TLD14312.1 hypothetical protein PgNI_04996 [Pyricularia grisea]